jgi:mRNA-degrading endonuclease RelE of RelBE toxin-antitoxin system
MPYTIEIAATARNELVQLPSHIKPAVADAIDQQLVHTPLVETRNRKPLKDETRASFEFAPPLWELRIGEYRIFYDVDVRNGIVTVRSVRRKPPGRTTAEVIHEGTGT